jgi:hypothetical protein
MGETERELLPAINGKLDRLIAVVAMQGRSQDEQIRVLRNLGFDWDSVGGFVGLKPAAARMRHRRSTS